MTTGEIGIYGPRQKGRESAKRIVHQMAIINVGVDHSNRSYRRICHRMRSIEVEQEEEDSPWNGYPLKQGRCMAAVAPKLLVTVMLLCSNRMELGWLLFQHWITHKHNLCTRVYSCDCSLVFLHRHSLVTMQLITNTVSWGIDWRRRRTVLATLTD